jgi:hypothetical protein
MPLRSLMTIGLLGFAVSGWVANSTAQDASSEAPQLTLLESRQTTMPPVIPCASAIFFRHGVPVWRGACQDRYATGDGTVSWYVSMISPYDGRYHYLHFRDEVVSSNRGSTIKDGLLAPVPDVLDQKARVTFEGSCREQITVRIDAEPDLRLDHPPVLRYFMDKYHSVKDKCPDNPGPHFWSFFVNGREVATLDGGGGSKGWIERIEANTASIEEAANRALDQQLRELPPNVKQEAFTTKYRVQKWMNPDQLKKDMARLEGQVVGLYGQFSTEIAFDKAQFFDFGRGTSFIASAVEPGQFKDHEQLVLAVKVRGLTRMKIKGVNYSLPDLAYVGSETCAAGYCRDYE